MTYLGIFFSLLLLFQQVQAGQSPRPTCAKPHADEPLLYLEDYHGFPWSMTLPQMKEKFESLYETPKRLYGRAYWDDSASSYILTEEAEGESTRFLVPELFIRSVSKHIENALKLGYVDFPFYPDMGHAHMHMPIKIYEEKFASLAPRREFLHRYMAEPSVIVLYHTAEKLKMIDPETKQPIDDPKLLQRYRTRNLTGTNDGEGRMDYIKPDGPGYNTFQNIEGHIEKMGFYLAAARDGCFSYEHRGRTFYFDISLVYPVQQNPPSHSE